MIVTAPKEIEKIAKQVSDPKTLTVVDVETDGLNPWKGNRICGLAIKDRERGKKYYIPFRHKRGKNASLSCLPAFAPMLANQSKAIAGHGFKFDAHMFEAEGMPVECKIRDTMLGCHLANENELSFKLEDLGTRYVDKNAQNAEAALLERIKQEWPGIKEPKEKLHELDPKEVAAYAENDVELTDGLMKSAYTRLRQDRLLGIWDEISEYLRYTIDMERNGVLIDLDSVREEIPIHQVRQEELLEQLQTMALVVEFMENYDCPKGFFNPNSSKQVQNLFNIISSSREILEDLPYPEADEILKYRKMTKVVGSFFEPMLTRSDSAGRLHASINLHGTISGRPSVSGPNLQALPKDGDFFRVRSKIIAAPDFSLASFDWSQIELRLLTHHTQDPTFVRVYEEDGDIHQQMADILGLIRDIAKRMNLGIVYGLGAEGLARKSKIDPRKARKVVEEYHEAAPGIRKLYRRCEASAKKLGYITMWTGRRRRYEGRYETRKAMSNFIQGGVAEIMRHTITRNGRVYYRSPDVRMLLQVHDELLFEIRDDLLAETIPAIKRTMEDYNFRVPIRVDCKVGKSWGNMTKWEG